MTKEELIQLSDEGNLSQYELEEFFSQNVCIPKGENRHPYADVLHKMAEDMTKSFQVKYIYQDLGWSTFDSYADYAFREKQQEPVYEWQWYKFVNGNIESTGDWEVQQYFTESEMKNDGFKKYEETKRVRNA